jgi:hypothetical protein
MRPHRAAVTWSFIAVFESDSSRHHPPSSHPSLVACPLRPCPPTSDCLWLRRHPHRTATHRQSTAASRHPLTSSALPHPTTRNLNPNLIAVASINPSTDEAAVSPPLPHTTPSLHHHLQPSRDWSRWVVSICLCVVKWAFPESTPVSASRGCFLEQPCYGPAQHSFIPHRKKTPRSGPENLFTLDKLSTTVIKH